MYVSTIILAVVAALFVLEIWSLIKEDLQEKARQNPWAPPIVVLICIAVLLSFGEKAFGAGDPRFVFYSAVLVFNASLFGWLTLKGFFDRKQDRAQQ